MNPTNSISIEAIVDLLEPTGLLVDFCCPKDVYSHSFTYLTYSSDDVKPNSLFICKGASFKEEYLQDAISDGAKAYMAEQRFPANPSLPFVIVSDIRKAMSLVAIAFYGRAFEGFTLVGITGTKGKTTTTYFMKNILDKACEEAIDSGSQSQSLSLNQSQSPSQSPSQSRSQSRSRSRSSSSAVLSTIEVYTGEEMHEAHLTTPESPDLQRYFAQTKSSGIPYLTMEVSSQAYKLSRVHGVEFDIGMFLNIGEDHIGPLEHSDFEDYFSCKLELMRHCKTAVINREMEEFNRVLSAAKEHCQSIITFGFAGSITKELQKVASCWQIDSIAKEAEGFTFTVSNNGESQAYQIGMAGRFNVENALAAIVSAKALGISQGAISQGLKQSRVQGRMNLFEKDGVTVLVDYAHNYLSFKRLYESLKADYPGRRIVALFGCPGGKALLRRRDIGTLSGQNADYIYLTAEDPQFEDVTAICKEIATFIEPYNVPYEIIPDRAQAVTKAIQQAKPGDVVLLAAKGEEVYQKVRGEYVLFESDLAIAKRCMQVA